MQLKVETAQIEKASADALAVICFETEERSGAEAPAARSRTNADPDIAAQSGWLADLRLTGEFTGKLYEMAVLHRPEGLAAKRLVVIGGGKRERFSSVEVRRLAGTLVRSLKPKGIRNIALLLDTPNGTNM